MFKQLGTFAILAVCLFALVCASVCPPVAASIWTSGKIVYTTNVYGDKDIAVMGPNGKFAEGLTTSNDDEYNPTWSPDGTEILYMRESAGATSVWLMDDDGSNQRQIVAGAVFPSWAPDGNRFVASRWRASLDIYTLNAARNGWSDRETIVSTGDPVDPAWSPDGKYIAYVAGAPAGGNPREGASLYVYDVAARRSTKIVSGSPGDWMWYPKWGPQSDGILFTWENAAFDDRTTKWAIFFVRRDGSGLDIMMWWPGYDLHSAIVAPYGGERIVVRLNPDTYTNDLYKVTPRTNNWQRLDPDEGTSHDNPDWWHPSSFSVEPGASQLTTTWGSLKKKAK